MRSISRLGLTCLLLGTAFSSFGQSFSIVPHMFFKNSTRRDATAYEGDHVARAGRGCSSFFVDNSSGKTFVGSARHCFSFNASSWCSGGGTFTKNDGEVGRCRRVVAGDSVHDVVLFEVDFPTAPFAAFRLASWEPPKGTRLNMIGYPADKYRSGKLTVTENCWILQSRTASPHGGNMNDVSSLHNCTTWGGNSGGPMIQDGQDVVVGLPFTYSPGNYTERAENELRTASHMAQMADFVGTFRSTLEKEGVTISD